MLPCQASRGALAPWLSTALDQQPRQPARQPHQLQRTVRAPYCATASSASARKRPLRRSVAMAGSSGRGWYSSSGSSGSAVERVAKIHSA